MTEDHQKNLFEQLKVDDPSGESRIIRDIIISYIDTHFVSKEEICEHKFKEVPSNSDAYAVSSASYIVPYKQPETVEERNAYKCPKCNRTITWGDLNVHSVGDCKQESPAKKVNPNWMLIDEDGSINPDQIKKMHKKLNEVIDVINTLVEEVQSCKHEWTRLATGADICSKCNQYKR